MADNNSNPLKKIVAQPEVSVVIPCYNAEKYLRQAIDSVFAQTYSNLELIVVNDGSTDKSGAILASYGDRIRVIHQQNQGLSAARNVGIASALGEYVAFLDADDYWQPDKLRQQIAVMEANPNLALCHTQFEMVEADGSHIRYGFGGGMCSYTELLVGCGIGVSTVVVRKILP